MTAETIESKNIVLNILNEELERHLVKEQKLITRCELLNYPPEIVKELEKTQFDIKQTHKAINFTENFLKVFRDKSLNRGE